MKFLNYLLAGVVGAFVASVATYKFVNRLAEDATGPAPVVRRAPARAPAVSAAALARVSSENAELKAQLDAARASLTEREASFKQTKEQLEELRRPMTADILSSALRAELKSGEVVVTGGYKLPNGKRLYAFAQPVIGQEAGAEVVKIESRFLSITDEAGKAVGLDSIATNAANTLQHGEVWVADEQTSVLAKLNASADTDMLASPSITVRPGTSGSIELGTLKLKVTPVVSADHANMDFDVRLEQPLQDPTAAPAAK